VFSAQASRTHQQHTLQSLKTTFLSRNLDQNMLKTALFFEKIWKIAAALGAPNPRWLLAVGGPQTPELLLLSPITVILSKAFIALTSLLSKRDKNNLK